MKKLSEDLKAVIIYSLLFISIQAAGVYFASLHYRNYPDDFPTWNSFVQAFHGLYYFLSRK